MYQESMITTTTTTTTSGHFTYQSDSVPRSVFSTKSIYLNRDTTGCDEEPIGLDPISISGWE